MLIRRVGTKYFTATFKQARSDLCSMRATLKPIIFDVEGTLIDCAAQSLESWRKALGEFGHSFRRDDLQPYSGMDAGDMVHSLLPAAAVEIRKQVIQRRAEIYENEYLRAAMPFPGVKDLFVTLRKSGFPCAIATTCKRSELAIYDRAMGILDLTDAVECGDDVKRGKPHPDLFRAVIRKLGLRDGSEAVAVGDTPYDAKAAAAVGMQAIGVLSGGFSRAELEKAGCACVVEEVRSLESVHWLKENAAPVTERSS